MNVVLIEPDQVLASNYKMVMEWSGHIVNHVSGAMAAIKAIDEKIPDIVILELLLPAHNGIEFLHEFRSYTEWQHIPVIVLSFVRKEELNTQALFEHLGVVNYLYKPQTKLAQLARVVDYIKG